MDNILVGDIVKINEDLVNSGFAGDGYNNDMRFEVLSIDEKYERDYRTEVIARLIGSHAYGIDVFSLGMLELVK